MAWIQVDDGIKEHDKIYNLADTLKISNAYAVGLMVCFWTWAVVSAPDGNITKFPPRAIAKAAGWEKKPEVFYNALLSNDIRFLEQRGDDVHIRNWEQRAELLIDYVERNKEKTRQRVQRYRDKKKEKVAPKESLPSGDSVTPSNGECNVTVTPSNGIYLTSTLPNQYLTNNTTPLPPALSDGNTDAGVTLPTAADALRCVLECFEEFIHPPKAGEAEVFRLLCESYPVQTILAAIGEAKGKGRSANYVKTILEEWKRTGVRESGKQDSSQPTYDLEEYEKLSGEIEDGFQSQAF